MADISNMEDVMDSRDVVERIEELEAERQELQDAWDEARIKGSDESEEDTATRCDETADALAEWDKSEEAEELKTLLAFREELEGYCGDKWDDGVTLIRDSYFKDYAQELAEDIGAINKDATWPNTCIDWEQAARELQMNYTSGEFDGITYWAR